MTNLLSGKKFSTFVVKVSFIVVDSSSRAFWNSRFWVIFLHRKCFVVFSTEFSLIAVLYVSCFRCFLDYG